MAIIIAINDGIYDLMIGDLGITIPKLHQVELVGAEGLFNIFEVTSSENLKALVGSGLIVINDGLDDLSVEDGIKHLTLVTEYEKGA